MKITAVNTTNQNHNLKNGSNEPTFKAKLLVTPNAKKTLQNRLLDFYIGCNPQTRAYYFGNEAFTFEKHFTAFKDVFEKTTRKIKGTVGLFAGAKAEPELAFKPIKGKYLKREGGLKATINKNALTPGAISKDYSVDVTIANLGCIMEDNGFVGKSNPFFTLLYKGFIS